MQAMKNEDGLPYITPEHTWFVTVVYVRLLKATWILPGEDVQSYFSLSTEKI